MIFVNEEDGNIFVIQNNIEGKGEFIVTTTNNEYDVSSNITDGKGMILAIRAIEGLTMERVKKVETR